MAGVLDEFKGKVVLLYTSYISNQLFEVHYRQMQTALQGLKVNFVEVDGAAPDKREIRSALWEVSGSRTYPQVFVDNAFVGDMTGLQDVIDSGTAKEVFAKYMKAE